jgi:hypothetical protein
MKNKDYLVIIVQNTDTGKFKRIGSFFPKDFSDSTISERVQGWFNEFGDINNVKECNPYALVIRFNGDSNSPGDGFWVNKSNFMWTFSVTPPVPVPVNKYKVSLI